MYGQVKRQRRRGATLVEAAVVLSAFFLFMLGIFEFGRFVMMRNLLDNAAREGARQAAAANTQTTQTSDIQATVTNYLAGQAFTNVTIQVYKINPVTQKNLDVWTNAAQGDSIAVQVNATYTPLPAVPFMPSSFAMQSMAVVVSEGN